MVRVITVDDVRHLIRKVMLKSFMLKLFDRLEQDYARWDAFDKTPRLANHYPHGVIELMPISDNDYYSFKFVNGHPGNPLENKQTVVATGTLADVKTGYPVLISEMTLLTALRTAVTSALASSYLSIKNPKIFGIIGTGAQSEFQVLAHHFILGVDTINYFDIDKKTMQKFSENLKPFGLTLNQCENAQAVAAQSQIITTATADKTRASVLVNDWIKPGSHINGIGGDCPGKTELGPHLMQNSKIVVEQIEQTQSEGEIQYLGREKVYAELWELVTKAKPGRTSDEEITLFDSVGFALEDYSVLRLVYQLAEQYHVGHVLDMVPEGSDPRDLFSLLHPHAK
jgi:ornithine cyclodeaminase